MGSTGSIGTQTLQVVEAYPERFQAVALTARSNWRLLAGQALKFKPKMVVIADERHYPALKEALSSVPVEVKAGAEALVEAAVMEDCDKVVGALVGYSGVPSVAAALEAGKQVALANKETLVAAGEVIDKIVNKMGRPLLPVDSEHSAIFQSLLGEKPESVASLILTASGGPFRELPAEELGRVTVEQALNHPNWNMGSKVTIDSATMMNKGFEMIEAKWLFHRSPDEIDVLVHPESVVHSLVRFVDGALKAQLGVPDMRVPIEVALAYPDRLDIERTLEMRPLDLAAYGSLTFARPDMKKFPLLGLAYDVARLGGLNPAVMNAANEVAVSAFIAGAIPFTDIYNTVYKTLDRCQPRIQNEEVTLDTIAAAHTLGTKIARELTGDNAGAAHKDFTDGNISD